MAHPCINCGGECYCHGDIDDAVVSKTPKSCDGCGCLLTEDYEHDFYDDDDEMDPVGFECLGCGKSFDNPGDCPICGNPLEPYG